MRRIVADVSSVDDNKAARDLNKSQKVILYRWTAAAVYFKNTIFFL